MAASYHLLTLLKPPCSSSSVPLLLKISLHRQLLQQPPHKSLALRLPALHQSPPPPRAKCLCTSSSYPQQEDLKQQLDLHSHSHDDDEQLTTSQSQSQEEEEKETHPLSADAALPPPPQIQQKLPKLTIKEKKELASYAHGLGKKLKIQLVGKSGVTDSLAAAFVENLESNELLKVKIHNSCPGELPDVIQQLEVTTGSTAVGQIGRSVILYRPSITKLKAEEKKRQNQRIIAAKSFRRKYTEFQVKPAEFRYKPEEKMERREAASNFSGRGKRGTGRS